MQLKLRNSEARLFLKRKKKTNTKIQKVIFRYRESNHHRRLIVQVLADVCERWKKNNKKIKAIKTITSLLLY